MVDLTAYDYVKVRLLTATDYIALMQGTRVVGLFVLDYAGGTKECRLYLRGQFRQGISVSEL